MNKIKKIIENKLNEYNNKKWKISKKNIGNKEN